MPYEVKAVKGGYKVFKKGADRRSFSRLPMTKENAEKQMRALYLYANDMHK